MGYDCATRTDYEKRGIMLIKDLLHELKSCDPETKIIMSSDSKGNNFSPLSGVGEGMYVALSTYSGELVDNDTEGAEAVIVLWPTN